MKQRPALAPRRKPELDGTGWLPGVGKVCLAAFPLHPLGLGGGKDGGGRQPLITWTPSTAESRGKKAKGQGGGAAPDLAQRPCWTHNPFLSSLSRVYFKNGRGKSLRQKEGQSLKWQLKFSADQISHL